MLKACVVAGALMVAACQQAPSKLDGIAASPSKADTPVVQPATSAVPASMPPGVMNDVLKATTLIIQVQAGNPVGTATGFFYVKADRLFLVTNRHVVLGDGSIKPDAFKLLLHTDANDLTKNGEFHVRLYSDVGAANFRLPTDPAVDVAVVAIDQNVGRFAIKALSAEQLPPADLIIQPGDDLLVIGFPRGLSDGAHNLPIVRRGMLSTPYGLNFAGHPMFLVDANLHPGTSGSPVLTPYSTSWNKPGTTLLGGAFYFLGIHSGTLNLNLPQGQEALGLGTAWYARVIEDVLAAWN